MAPDPAALRDTLTTGLAELNLSLTAHQQSSLLAYVELLAKWNKVYNLTAVRDPLRMVSRHLLDSLTVLPFIHGKSLVDIGTGAGLPGVPLAIVRPDLQCVLLDSNSKKTRFVQQSIAQLELHNIEAVHARVQDSRPGPFDTVVSRAFSSPLDIIGSAGHLCASDGSLVFMLGHSDGLLDKLPAEYELARLESVTVPFESGTRHIAICRHRRL